MKFAGKHRTPRQRGFTLLESLISLVVLSVGMLGIAALYVEGVRAGRTAVYRTTAVNLAADMMDRIRANPQARFAYQGGGAANNCVNGGNNCSAQQMAQEDVLLWTNEVTARMPGGVGANVAVVNNGVVDTYTITVQWPEPGFDGLLSYSLVARL